MKTIAILGSKLQSELLIGHLKSHGIDAFMNGSREYAGIVTGTDVGRYEISTSDENADAALAYMSKLNQPGQTVSNSPLTPNALLKRAIMFAAMAVIILPIVFNVMSVWNMVRYAKTAGKSPTTVGWLFAILILNSISAVVGVMLFKMIINQ
jgi:hypothetical protein